MFELIVRELSLNER